MSASAVPAVRLSSSARSTGARMATAMRCARVYGYLACWDRELSARLSRITTMTDPVRSRRAHALAAELFGTSDPVADRVVEVLHAHAAALAWVRDTTGSYPAPVLIAARLDSAAERLRAGIDDREPVAVLKQTAIDALAAYQPSAAT
jgi:hypothetical protein